MQFVLYSTCTWLYHEYHDYRPLLSSERLMAGMSASNLIGSKKKEFDARMYAPLQKIVFVR